MNSNYLLIAAFAASVFVGSAAAGAPSENCKPSPECKPTATCQTKSNCAVLPSSKGQACVSTCSTAATGGIAVDPAVNGGVQTGITPESLGLTNLGPLLEEVRAAYKVPGLALAVFHDGELREAGVAGVRQAGGTDPIQLDDRFHLGSCGKAFTATLAAVLVSEKKLLWSTRLRDAFPDLNGTEAAGSGGDYLNATLGELLSHRGGLPSLQRPDSELWKTFASFNGTPRIQRRNVVTLAVNQEPVGLPGQRFEYTDLGYSVAGAMLEELGGASWETLIRTRIAEPLGMTTLGFGAPGSDDPRRTSRSPRDHPWGHVYNETGFQTLPPGPGADLASPTIAPAGTIHSSILDWARFAGAHLRGARGESTPILDAGAFEDLHGDPYNQGYGLGWVVDENPETGRVLAHTGSCGAWAAMVWILPEQNLAMVATSNYGGTEAFQACRAAMDRTLASRRP